MSIEAASLRQAPQLYLPWRGRYYLPLREAAPLLIARSLAEALPQIRGQQPGGPSPGAHQPTYPRGVAALLRDYRLVELDAPAPPADASPRPTHAEPRAAADGAPAEPLTKREREVLKLLAAGLSNSEIAARLMLTPGTVKWHTHNLYGKLGAARRTQAVARAYALGLLDDA